MAKGLPAGSSAFERAMADVSSTPVVEISYSDDVDNVVNKKDAHGRHHHHEEGTLVHGLHHCYKVEGGQCLTSFRCNHDHHRVSNGHLEDITHVSGTSPTPRRRLSMANSGAGLLAPEEGYYRGRSNSDASQIRRTSVAGSPGSQRRGSVISKGSNEGSPSTQRRASMSISPKSQRRGSNVGLQSDELHYVYDQYFSKK